MNVVHDSAMSARDSEREASIFSSPSSENIRMIRVRIIVESFISLVRHHFIEKREYWMLLLVVTPLHLRHRRRNEIYGKVRPLDVERAITLPLPSPAVWQDNGQYSVVQQRRG